MNEQNANGTVTPTPDEAAKRKKRNKTIAICVVVFAILLFISPIVAVVCFHFYYNPPGDTYVYKGDKNEDDVIYRQYTKLVIKDGVETIPDQIFRFGNFKDGVSIPDSVVRIGKESFYGTDLTEIVIPDSVTEIGIRAFSNCSDLRSVKLSNNLSEIAPGTFYYCGELTGITVPNGV